ncbi:hypothetical protein JCM11491_005477 [Sporobolomyces phaffii]
MAEDLLPHLGSPLAVRISDWVLSSLTDPHRPARRRCSTLALLVVVAAACVSLPFLVLSPSLPRARAAARADRRVGLDPADLRLWIDHHPPRPARSDVPITAVVVYDRLTTRFHVEYLAQFPFIHEIIVWNDSDSDNDDLVLPSPSPSPSRRVRVYNSPARVGSLAVHYACLVASPETRDCYVPSQNSLNRVLAASHAHYVELGRETVLRIVAQDDNDDAPRWSHGRVVDRALGLDTLAHAFDGRLGGGVFFPRAMSRTFLDQVDYLSTTPLPARLTLSPQEWLEYGGTVAFDVWTNHVPEVWTVRASPSKRTARARPHAHARGGLFDLTEREFRATEARASRERDREIVSKALEILVYALRVAPSTSSPPPSSSSGSTRRLPRPWSPFAADRARAPRARSHARAPCLNDACIFLTSLPELSPDAALAVERVPVPSSSPAAVLPVPMKNNPDDDEGDEGTPAFFAVDLDLGPGPDEDAPIDAHDDDDDQVDRARIQRTTRTCFEPARRVVSQDYYGLEFLGHGGSGHDDTDEGDGVATTTTRGGRTVRRVEVVGSRLLGGVVSWDREDDVFQVGSGSGSGSASAGWVVYTQRRFGRGGWEPRQLVGGTSSTTPTELDDEERRGGATMTRWTTRFELVPIETRTTFVDDDDPARGTFELAERREVEIARIKLVRIGGTTKPPDEANDDGDGGKFSLCGWNLDGWEV